MRQGLGQRDSGRVASESSVRLYCLGRNVRRRIRVLIRAHPWYVYYLRPLLFTQIFILTIKEPTESTLGTLNIAH